MSSMLRRAGSLAALLVVSLATASCGERNGDDDAIATTAESTTTTLPAMPSDFDWWAPEPVSLGGDWVLDACEHEVEATVLCYAHPDGRSGTIEHFRFPAPPSLTLNAHAARFVEDFLADRRIGCGEGYRVEAEPIEALGLPDGDARRYGFSGGSGGSATTERTVQWAGLRDGALVILTVSAYDPGSCVAPEDQGTLDALQEVLPALEALVLASGLPTVTP